MSRAAPASRGRVHVTWAELAAIARLRREPGSSFLEWDNLPDQVRAILGDPLYAEVRTLLDGVHLPELVPHLPDRLPTVRVERG